MTLDEARALNRPAYRVRDGALLRLDADDGGRMGPPKDGPDAMRLARPRLRVCCPWHSPDRLALDY